MLKIPQIFDYGIPYHIFTGLWGGVQALYKPDGEFNGIYAFKVAIYWEEPYSLMHFRQDPTDSLAFVKEHNFSETLSRLTTYEFDLQINGKYATGSGVAGLQNTGAETTPDTYIFHIIQNNQSWINNQYCPTANERRVIGPWMDQKGNIQQLISQHLTRISYEVPPRYRRALLSE